MFEENPNKQKQTTKAPKRKNKQQNPHKANQDSWEFLMLRSFHFEISWFFMKLPCCTEGHEVPPYIICQSWLSTMGVIQV